MVFGRNSTKEHSMFILHNYLFGGFVCNLKSELSDLAKLAVDGEFVTMAVPRAATLTHFLVAMACYIGIKICQLDNDQPWQWQ